MSGAKTWIAGVDLAWGERRKDAVCLLSLRRGRAQVEALASVHGDEALLAALGAIPATAPAVVAVDGPIVCPNPTGARPVDREVSRRFWREHAGCHPANATRCPRPARVAAALVERGFAMGDDLDRAPRLVMEVYPHPAMVHLFRLPRILKYKRGSVVEKDREFRRLQSLLQALLEVELDVLQLGPVGRALLARPWSREAEDQTDAFFCALVGLWHVVHRGRRSLRLGDLATGFIVLPEDLRGR